MTSCFFLYNFWGVNNMYLGLRGGGESYTCGVRVVHGVKLVEVVTF